MSENKDGAPDASGAHDRELVRGQFQDLLRRMDHHARILQRASVEFFKSMALTQAGGIISVMTVLFSSYSRVSDIRQSPANTLPSIRNLGPQWAAMAQSAEWILTLLLIGLLCSLTGYALMYKRHNDRTEFLRKQINEILFEGKTIEVVHWPSPGPWEYAYAGCSVVSVVTFGLSVGIAVFAVQKIL